MPRQSGDLPSRFLVAPLRALSIKPRAKSKEENPEPIAFRKDFHSDNPHLPEVPYTGYLPNPREDENFEKSPLYKLPAEVLFRIMESVGPVDLFFVMQTSRRFLALFLDRRFARYHEHRFPRLNFCGEDLDEQRPPPRDPQAVVFLKCAYPELRTFVRKRLKIAPPPPGCTGRYGRWKPRDISGRTVVCRGCNTWQHVSWFSRGSLGHVKPSCIAREFKHRVCPHRHISLSDPIKWQRSLGEEDVGKIWECRQCALEMRRPGDCPPSLHVMEFVPTWKPSTWEVPKDHRLLISKSKLQVCTIEPTQIVTKDFLREKLKQLRHFDQLLCPHAATFDDDFLMRPFGWDRCFCFMQPVNGKQLIHHHSYHDKGSDLSRRKCCACANHLVPENMGRFMALNSPGYHSMSCSKCLAEYEWSMEGKAVMLSVHRRLLDLKVNRVTGNDFEGLAKVKLDPSYELSRSWLEGPDVTTSGNLPRTRWYDMMEYWLEGLDVTTSGAHPKIRRCVFCKGLRCGMTDLGRRYEQVFCAVNSAVKRLSSELSHHRVDMKNEIKRLRESISRHH